MTVLLVDSIIANTLEPRNVANIYAELLHKLRVKVIPFPEGAEKTPGAEVWISDDRCVMVIRQYRIECDDYQYAVRVQHIEAV
jgi:hypothetical protein